MRRAVMFLVLTATIAACDGGSDEPVGDPVAPSPAGPTLSSPTSAVAVLPDGVPETYGVDVAARELPLDELVPAGDEVTGVDRANAGGAEAVVITFASPGADPFARARGIVVWRRSEGVLPPWRAVYGISHGARSGVLAIATDATDLTGDGSDDALVREETGGTGACATYRVIDLAMGASIWKRSVCDAEVQPNPDPLGLFVVSRVFEPDDSHCCPSAVREQVLAWRGDRFTTVSDEVTRL